MLKCTSATLLFFSLFFSVSLNAQSFDEYIKEEVTLKFIGNDDEGNTKIVPDLNRLRSVGLPVTEKDQFEYLQIVSEENEFDFWLNNRLIEKNVDSVLMSRTTILSDSTSAFIVISGEYRLESIRAFYYHVNTGSVKVRHPIFDREHISGREFLIITVCLMIGIIGTLKHFNTGVFTNLLSLERISRRDNEIGGGNFLFENAILSFLVALCYLFLIDAKMSQQPLSLFSMITWLKYSGMLFLAFSFKYYAVRWIARLNGFNQISFLQHSIFLKVFSMTSVLLLFIITMNYWLDFYSDNGLSKFWSLGYMLVYLVFLVYLFIWIGSVTRAKKLHIISYLCSTEFLGAFFIALVFT